MPAPILIFAYNRPVHLRRTVDSLRQNHLAGDSDLFVFSDGPRTREDQEKIREIREYLGALKGFKTVTVREAESNMGLAKSIISGVTEVVNSSGTVIVLEDDMVTSPWFLTYMNDGLDLYRDDERVAGIHAYAYPVSGSLPETFFLKGADCWGWATWSRAWRLFNTDGKALLSDLKNAGLLERLDFDGAFPYQKMLKAQVAGRNDSWAIRWYASALLAGKLTLYPGRTLIDNIGHDNSGSHSARTGMYSSELSESRVIVGDIMVEENRAVYEAFRDFFRDSRPGYYGAILTRLLEGRLGRIGTFIRGLIGRKGQA